MNNEEGQVQEDIFDKLARGSSINVPDEHKISIADFKEAFRQSNKAVKEVKTYNITLREGDGYDTYEIEADEFFISQGVMFFKLKEEFQFMLGISNLIRVEIEEQ